MLFVYCIDTKKKIKNIVLPKEVAKHINQYKNNDFRKTSKLAWTFLLNLLKSDFKINFNKDKILFNKNNKPHLKSKKIYFNLSHSLNLIAIAISNKPVGVDVEKIIPAKICNLVAKRVLNKNELKQFLASKNKSDYLTQKWTQKEAYVKLVGSTILNIDKLCSIKTKNINTLEIYDDLNNKYYLSFTNHK